MRIMTIGTTYIGYVLFCMIFYYYLGTMTVKTKLLACPFQQMFGLSHMRFMAGGAISGTNWAMNHLVLYTEIVVTLIAEHRLWF